MEGGYPASSLYRQRQAAGPFDFLAQIRFDTRGIFEEERRKSRKTGGDDSEGVSSKGLHTRDDMDMDAETDEFDFINHVDLSSSSTSPSSEEHFTLPQHLNKLALTEEDEQLVQEHTLKEIREREGAHIAALHDNEPDANHRVRAAFEPTRIQHTASYFLTQARKVRVYYRSNEQQELRLRRLRTRSDVATDPMREMRQTPGDVRYRKLLDTLDNFQIKEGERMERSPVQRMFHRWFIQANLPWIYAKDWESNQQRVLKQHHLNRIFAEVFCISPRRFGKTLSMSTFETALITCVPSMKSAVFSTGGRNSELMMDLVHKFVLQTPNGKARICTKNKERLFISPNSSSASIRLKGAKNNNNNRDKAQEPGTSEFYSYPATVDGTVTLSPLLFLVLFDDHRGPGPQQDRHHEEEKGEHKHKECGNGDDLIVVGVMQL